MTRTLLLAALGGALGSRAGVGLALPFPLATFAVDVAGSSAMGLLFALPSLVAGGAGRALGRPS